MKIGISGCVSVYKFNKLNCLVTLKSKRFETYLLVFSSFGESNAFTISLFWYLLITTQYAVASTHFNEKLKSIVYKHEVMA